MKKGEFNSKIVVLGMQRTGTTSISEALLSLGYSIKGTPRNSDELVKQLHTANFESALEIASSFDVLEDLPWLFLYKELDKSFPGSKFILTIRNEKSWIKSMIDHFSNSDTKMRQWAYGHGCPLNNEDIYLLRFREHYKEVSEYFKNRPSDILIMDLSKGDGWDKLCNFLGVSKPKKKFPHSNKSNENHSFLEKVKINVKNNIPLKIRIKLTQVLRNIGFRKDYINFD